MMLQHVHDRPPRLCQQLWRVDTALSFPAQGRMNSSALGTQPLNQLYFQDGMIKRVREPDADSEDGSFVS